MGSLSFACVLGAIVLQISSAEMVPDEDYVKMPPLFHLDDFDRCMMLQEMLFCSVTIQLAPKTNHSDVWPIIQRVIKSPKNFRHDRLRYGICLPTYCPNVSPDAYSLKNDDENLGRVLSNCFSEKFEEMGLIGTVTKSHCENDQPFYAIGWYDVLVGFILGALGVLIIFSSFYEGIARYNPEEGYQAIASTTFGKFVSCFSIRKNWERFCTSNKSPETQSFKCLHGMRFVFMFGVVMAHTYMIVATIPISNPQYMERATEEFMKILLLNGSYWMQSLFLVSGFLLSYLFFINCEGRDNVSWVNIIYGIIHRYVRLTPCLLVVVLFCGTWFSHISRGPFWDHIVGNEYRNCRENWWTNILYISNYYNKENMCLEPTWYVAVDMQVFTVCLFLTMLMWKYERHIKIIVTVSLTISIAITATVNYINDYDILLRSYPETVYNLFLDNQQFLNMYASGYTNASCYILGLGCGYVFYKNRGKRLFDYENKFYVFLWWIMGYGLGLGVIQPAAFMYGDNFSAPRIVAALYPALGRPIFGLATAIAVYGFSRGVGWVPTMLFNWPLLEPLGKLTYCAFLIHPIPIKLRVATLRNLTYCSDFTLIMQVLGDVVASYCCALCLCLCVELPVSALTKLIIPQSKKAPPPLKSTIITVVNKDDSTKM